MNPPTCQSLSPVYPSPHGGSEEDDRGSNDQTVGGGQTEVVALELQHVAASSEPPHVVPPGGESVGPVHSPGHLSLNLQAEQSGREGTVKTTISPPDISGRFLEYFGPFSDLKTLFSPWRAGGRSKLP